MRRKRILLAALLLPFVAASIWAADVPAIITISNDDVEAKYELATVQQIVPTDGSFTLKRTAEEADVTDVRCLIFGTMEPTPTGITPTDEAMLYIYPNPVAETLRIDGAAAGSTLVVYDLQGRTLLQTTENQLNVSALAEGTYLLKVNNQVVKFIKK